MTINYAILGILSYRPITGYDLKKLMQDSIFMHWSGNNNQIYKALTELLDEGFVTNETKYQEGAPSKKIYTITQSGLDELKDWELSTPEPVEFKKTVLVQLAWADMLSNDELCELLHKYENEISLQLVLNREKIRRGSGFVFRTDREALLWRMIDENVLLSYQNELMWVQNVLKQLKDYDLSEETSKVHYNVVKQGSISYIEVDDCKKPIKTAQDALDLVALCGEKNINLLLIHREALDEDFFKLKSGVAGEVLQKFINYSVKAAILVPNLPELGARFRELASEANKGNQYCFVQTDTEAVEWYERSCSNGE